MKRSVSLLAASLALAALSLSSATVHAQTPTAPPTALNFQGRLATPSGNPVPDGTYSVRFRFYDAATAGSVLYEKTIANVAVKNGTFAVKIDGFTADKFNGSAWLGIAVGNDAELTPRTQIVSVPYALKSNLALTVPDGSITNSKIAAGTLTADRFVAGLFDAQYWGLRGNSVTTGSFLGTTDDNPLEFRVNNRRAMRYQYAANSGSRTINVLGGSEVNTIGAGVLGATIAGGGADGIADTDSDVPNAVTANYGTIGGGAGNTASGPNSTVGGGVSNTASFDSAVVGGGQLNTANGNISTVGGGSENMASGNYASVGAGYRNKATSTLSAVGGGSRNTSGGNYSTVAGGNSNTASGNYATIAGGNQNTASGSDSMAAGSRARALHNSTFVWKSYDGTDFDSTASNQFLISASGGVGIGTNAPKGALHVNGDYYGKGHLFLHAYEGDGTDGTAYIQARDDSPTSSVAMQLRTKQGGTVQDVMRLNANGNVGIGTTLPATKLDVNGAVRCTSLTQTSDARYKTHVETIPDALDALLNLRGVTFDWRKQEFPKMNFSDGKQIGFIAQEVEKVLPELVTTDTNGYKSVAYANVVPVAVEAIKTLNARTVMQQKQMDAKDAQIAELEAKLDAILKRLEAMEKQR